MLGFKSLADLFDALLERGDARALARSGAPATSVAAAESIDATNLETIVYQTVHSFGPKGCISDQVQAELPELAYSSVTARFKRLIENGHLIVTGTREGRSGRQQRIMVAKGWVNGMPRL